MTDQTAANATAFINSLGINTHVDGYDTSAAEQAISYLGISNLRDSAESPGDLSLWQQISQATGAKFDDYIGETSPGGMQSDLNFVPQLAQEGVLNAVEGGNEEDDTYPASLGNNLQTTAAFQPQVAATAHSLGLPAINMSFGAGWTAANNWQGDYGAVGNLSAYADYANAHTYPNPGQTPDSTIQRLNGLADLAASGQPVITTEVGWDGNAGFSQTDVAKYVVDAALDGWKDGDAKTYYYALFDDASGAFGLMNADGSPKPAGTALHNLTTLLGDSGDGATGSLDYSLGGTAAGDNSLLLEKSDGSYWLALWNESGGDHTVTLNLTTPASAVNVYDPLTGTSPVQSDGATGSAQITLSDDPLLVQIVPTGGGAAGPSTASADDTMGFIGANGPMTITLPPASDGVDQIAGSAMQNGDVFDLTAALAQTGWDGDPASVGDFLHVTSNGTDSTVAIDPTGSGAPGTPIATLHGAGSVDLSTLLAHSIIGGGSQTFASTQ
jgi:serralysin